MNEQVKMPSRSQRRLALKYQGTLKAIGMLSHKQRSEIRQSTLSRGKEAHAAHCDAVDKSRYERLEQKEIAMMSTWKELGYTDDEINSLREAWQILAVGGATREEKKSARELMKSAREQLQARNAK